MYLVCVKCVVFQCLCIAVCTLNVYVCEYIYYDFTICTIVIKVHCLLIGCCNSCQYAHMALCLTQL